MKTPEQDCGSAQEPSTQFTMAGDGSTVSTPTWENTNVLCPGIAPPDDDGQRHIAEFCD